MQNSSGTVFQSIYLDFMHIGSKSNELGLNQLKK
jgi:hypothetical protein